MSLGFRVALIASFLISLFIAGCSGDDDEGASGSDSVVDADATPVEAGADAPVDGADVQGDAPDGGVEGLRIFGLSRATTAWIDQWGILHARCATDEDCAAVLGYFHARDRFAQMDIRRRVTTGRLSQLVGELGLDNSVSNRLLYSTLDGLPAEDRLLDFASEKSLALLEAYSNGVNAWLDDLDAGRNGATLPAEYDFPLVSAEDIPRWTPQDSLATILALINSLTNDSYRELALAERYAALDEATAFDLFGPMPATDTTIMDGFELPKARATVDPPRAMSRERLNRALPALRSAGEIIAETRVLDLTELEDPGGSNNWVIGPGLTSGGNALLSNDPHLGLTNPSIWYYAHLDAKTDGTGDIHVAGQSFAGLPWIVIGQNESIAWGATNSYFDMSDVYIGTLSEDATGVLFDGGVVPFVEREYTFDVAGGQPVTRTLRWLPHHGPVLSIDEEAGTAISLAWTGNRVSTDVNFLTEIAAASTVIEARAAATNVTSLGQNWVVVDIEGNIGWFPYNHVPQRPWASAATPSWLPLPGDGSAEWGEPLAYDALPQLLNPAAGYIATANNDMTGALLDGDPNNDGSTPLQVYSATGFRAARIVDLLESTGPHDVASMQRVVGDVHSLIGEWTVPAILEIAAGASDALTPAGASVLAALDAWDFECPTGLDGVSTDSANDSDSAASASSIGCSAFHVMLGRLRTLALGDEVAAVGLDAAPKTDALVHLLVSPERLRRGEVYWDDVSTVGVDETPADIVAAALNGAGAFLADTLGDDITDWRWGRLHTVTLRADLFDSFGVEAYNNGPYANDGGLYTVDVASPRSLAGDDYSHSSGPSTRFVCEALSTGPSCTVQLPGGQRHYADAEHYEDLLQRWLTNTPTPLIFDVAAVEALGAEAFTFEPTGGSP